MSTFWKGLGRSLVNPCGSLFSLPGDPASLQRSAGNIKVAASPWQGWRTSCFTSPGFNFFQYTKEFGLEDPMWLASWHHLCINFPLCSSTKADKQTSFQWLLERTYTKSRFLWGWMEFGVPSFCIKQKTGDPSQILTRQCEGSSPGSLIRTMLKKASSASKPKVL